MRRLLFFGCFFCAVSSWGGSFWKEIPDGVELTGNRAVVRIANGRIVQISLREGAVFSEAPADAKAVGGLGVLSVGQEGAFSRCHPEMATPLTNPVPLTAALPFYRLPDKRSSLRVSKAEKGGCEIVWKGLASDKAFFPKDEIVLRARLDENGAIALKARAMSASKGVFGMRFSVEGVKADSEAVLPVLAGMRFPLADWPEGESAFLAGGRRLDAPLAILEREEDACALWSEDDSFVPHEAFIRKEAGTVAVALEFFNPMPFEDRTHTDIPEVKIDCFPNGGWVSAATPYRNWYRRRFAEELSIRDSKAAEEIRVVMQDAIHRPTAAQLGELAHDYGGHLLWYVSKLTEEFTKTWRWDWMLPGHTPDLSLLPKVREIQARGIRIAPYAIAMCVNYGSPAFVREDVPSIVRPTAMKLAYYQPPERRRNRWDIYQTNELVYVDMNTAAWRRRMADTHVRLLEALAVDTLYEDCLGVVNDPGNGPVDGKWGAQGQSAFAREMLVRLKRPLMAEYGNAAVAFAVKWPLVETADFVGCRAFTEFRKHHQVPLSAYLFGYRPWNSGSHPWLAESDRLMMEVSCSDATGGLGFLVLPPYGKGHPVHDHLIRRAKLFNEKALKPVFPKSGRYPKGVTGYYRGTDGIYTYCDDGRIQTMKGSDGQAVYSRDMLVNLIIKK